MEQAADKKKRPLWATRNDLLVMTGFKLEFKVQYHEEVQFTGRTEIRWVGQRLDVRPVSGLSGYYDWQLKSWEFAEVWRRKPEAKRLPE